jgi:hypothetical protein
VATTFYTEKPKAIEGKIEEKDYYKLFARLCSRGPTKGRPHQLGVGLTCGQCDLIFNENPTLNYIADADPKKAKDAKDAEAAADLKLKSHIEAQGIIINEETFNDLLMTSRLVSAVTETPTPEPPKANQTFEWLANHPPAMDGWVPMLSVTQKALRELLAGGPLTKIQIAEAAAGIVKAVADKEELIKERLGSQAYAYVESMLKRSPRECGESISTYLLIPYQRWLSGFRASSLYILDSYELSSGTKDDILNKGMGQHLQVIGGEELEGIAFRKVKAFVADLSVACSHIFPNLRPLLTPGGKDMVQYIMRAYLMSAIHRFIDPHQIPTDLGQEGEDGQEEEGGVPNMKLLYKSLGQALTKYAVGSKVPTEEEIRTRLEQRAEEEKQVFINKLDKMGREEKRVELVLKGLGMGAWAAGGSKAIRKYDAERYEVERAERAAAGIMDYPGGGGGGGGGEQEQGRAVDMFGFNFGGEYDAAGETGEGGYDHEQMGEDDY